MAKKSSRDYDDRPVKRKKPRRKSGGGQTLLFVGLGLFVFLLVAGGVVWIVSLRKTDKEKEKERLAVENAPKNKILRLLPDKPVSVRSSTPTRLFANQHYMQMRDKLKADFEWSWGYNNIPKEKVERLTECSGKDSVVILNLTEPTTAAEIRQKNTSTAIQNSWKEEKVGQQTLHIHTSAFQVIVPGGTGRGGDPSCFFMPDDKTVVFGIADALRPIMLREGQPPELTPGFEAAYSALDFDKPIITLEDRSAEGSHGMNYYTDKPCSVDFRVDVDKTLQVTKTVTTEFGPEIVTTSVFVCKTEADAQYLKTTIEKERERRLKDAGADARDYFKNHTLTISGTTLTVTNRQNLDAVLAWGKKHPGGYVIGK